MQPVDLHDLDLAVRGDAAAFGRVVDQCYDLIFRVACKWAGNRADAEDITQEVCVKLGQSIRSYKGEAAFSSWLYRVTLNAVRDFQRQAGRRPSGDETALDALTDEAPDAEAALAARQLWQQVAALEPKQRDAVILVYSEGLSHAEAATILDCAESTVSWLVHEATKRLRKTYEASHAG